MTDPNWLDRRLYPYKSHYYALVHGNLHYVDKGEGEPVLMLHGNPTWSFFYRHLIDCLSPYYRCVAPDFLGFGLSDKPDTFSYKPEDHARCVEALIDELGLRNVTLVLHDWGGPIGLWYATHHPENVKRIVAMNTWAWPLDSVKQQAFALLLGNPLGEWLTTRFNFFARSIMPAAFGHREQLTEHLHQHYLGPLDTPQARAGAAAFPGALQSDWLEDLYGRLDVLQGHPMLLVWGMDDPAFGGELARWESEFPFAEAIRLPDVGHFVPEEAEEALCKIVPDWMARTPLAEPMEGEAQTDEGGAA